MTQIVLEVPFVTQLGFGDPSNLKSDPTGCWYASACMVAFSFEAGPRFGAPQLYKKGLGFYANGKRGAGHEAIMPGSADEDGFLKAEGLEKIPNPVGSSYAAEQLADLVRKFGPIMFYWTKTAEGNEYGHASVLIGVIGQNVIYHDPENAPRSTMSIAKFNSVVGWDWPTTFLRRSGVAYQVTPPMIQVTLPAPIPKKTVASNLRGHGLLGRLRRRR
jgi:hypothetical protein